MASAGPPRGVSRRSFIGGLSTGMIAGSAGCIRRARTIMNRASPEQISLSIKTAPADTDRVGVMIARHLENHLEQVGIDVVIDVISDEELHRGVLINQDFDLCVLRHPGDEDPDFLRPLVHSRFKEEPGWQNPYGFVDITVDELIDQQVGESGTAREETVAELLREVANLQPFVVIGMPDTIRVIRSDRFRGRDAFTEDPPFPFLTARPRDATEDDTASARLTVATNDSRSTLNFNPISVEFRSQTQFTDLVYEPLARRVDGKITPWTAESWSWEHDETRRTLRVRLREGVAWHDGEPLTAADVAFTYRFLSDTSLDTQDYQIPAPRFRGRTSLVSGVVAHDDRTVELSFDGAGVDAAARALTVPLLPRHLWEEMAEPVDVVGFELFEGVTEALVWDNTSPVGSGPYRVEEMIARDSLILTRNPGHFLGDSPPEIPERFHGGPAFDELVVRVAPSEEAALDLIRAGEIDATAAGTDPRVVPTVLRSEHLDLAVRSSRAFYQVGFNVRRSPMANPHFRRAVAQLIDKNFLIEEVFDGYAVPAAAPTGAGTWTPSDLQWAGSDPIVPFQGEDGELNVDRAIEMFVDAGYQYSDQGRLLRRAS